MPQDILDARKICWFKKATKQFIRKERKEINLCSDRPWAKSCLNPGECSEKALLYFLLLLLSFPGEPLLATFIDEIEPLVHWTAGIIMSMAGCIFVSSVHKSTVRMHPSICISLVCLGKCAKESKYELISGMWCLLFTLLCQTCCHVRKINEIGLTEFAPDDSIWVVIQHFVSTYMLVIMY